MSPRNLNIAVSLTALFGSSVAISANENVFSGIFVISDITVTNDEAYQRYREKVKPVIENCGGTYVVRAGAKFVTDNPTSALLNASREWNPDRIVVLHFDTADQAAACFESPEYKAVFALRKGGATGRSLVVHAFRSDE